MGLARTLEPALHRWPRSIAQKLYAKKARGHESVPLSRDSSNLPLASMGDPPTWYVLARLTTLAASPRVRSRDRSLRSLQCSEGSSTPPVSSPTCLSCLA